MDRKTIVFTGNGQTAVQDEQTNSRLDTFYRREVRKTGFNKANINIDESRIDKIVAAYLENYYYRFGTGLFIQGNTFSGKTSHLAYVALRIIQEAGFYGLAGRPDKFEYWSSPAKGSVMYLHPLTVVSNFSRKTDDKLVDFIKKAVGVEYLFIDDIDRIGDKQYLVRLENIIERRYSNSMTTIVTSTKDANKLKARVNYKRIMRILHESCQFVQLQAEPYQYDINFT